MRKNTFPKTFFALVISTAAIGTATCFAQKSTSVAHVRTIVRSLFDPAKLSTLQPRSASDRIDKAMYWLNASGDPATVMAGVVADIGWSGTPKGALLVARTLANLEALDRFGCLTPENLELLRRGRAPTITTGPYRGEIVELDHIVPVAHAPQWSNVIANHQYLPRSVNRSKGDTMGPAELAHKRILIESGF